MSVQTILRVFDCLLNEGTKVLYRTGLALLALNEKRLLKVTDGFDFFTKLTSKTGILFDADKLMKV